jgi:serine/threonine-protein kinase
VLDAARRHRADFVLQGVAQRTADRVRISYSLVDVKTSSQVGDSVTGPANDLFALPDLVAEGVLRMAGAPSLGQSGDLAGLSRPEDQQSYLLALGLLHRMKDQAALDEAIRRLEALLPNARDSAPLNGALGKALLQKYAYSKQSPLIDQASVYATRAAEIDPSLADVHVTLGELKKTGGDFEGAAAEYQTALRLRSEFPSAILGLAETYEKMGRGADAEREYQRVLILAPDWPSVYAKYGRYCLNHNAVQKAADLFGHMVQLMPDSPRGYANLGGALTMLGRYDEALQAYRHSLAIEPSYSAYSNLGVCQYTLGKFSDAAVSFEKAASLMSDHYIYWMNLGDARRWSGQQSGAAEAYRHAIDRARAAVKVNPKDAVAHAVIASSLAKLGRSAEAAKEIDIALKADPINAEVLFAAAVVALRHHDREGAAAWLQRAVAAGYSASQAARDPELAELH